MKKILLSLAVILVSAVSLPSVSMAKDTIIWTYFSYPPLYIIEKGKVSGIGIEIQNLLWKNMPEYTHERVEASVQRMFEDMKHGKKYCVIGALKNPEREAFLHYSLPCRIELPEGLMLRRSDLQKYGAGSEVSLEELLKTGHFTLGYLKGSRDSGILDTIIREYQEKKKVVTISGTDSFQQLLKMIDAGRIDGIIGNSFTVKEAGFEDRIAVVPIKENRNNPIIGYAVCPKNDWGKQVIDKINAILKKEIPTEKYLQIYTPWIDKQSMPRFRELYEEYLVKPAISDISADKKRSGQ